MKKQEKLEEIFLINETLRNILLQKQILQEELSNSELGIKELKNSKGNVFKIIGEIMVETKREELEKELLERKKITELRLKNFEHKEKSLRSQIEFIRNSIVELDKKNPIKSP